MMYERLAAGDVTSDRIKDHVVKFCGHFDEKLYKKLKLCQLIIQGWAGHMILIPIEVKASVEVKAKKIKKAKSSWRFACGILSGDQLILDDERGAFFPTGGKHLSGKLHDICVEPLNISASSPELEFLFGDYRVMEWFREKRKLLRFKKHLKKLQ